MTWELLVILFLVVGSNIGQSFFTVARLTSLDFVQSIFKTENKASSIIAESEKILKILTVVGRELETVKNQMTDLKSELLIIKSTQHINHELFLDYLDKHAASIKVLSAKIEEHGRIIFKK